MINCGQCHEKHGTVAEVRACHGIGNSSPTKSSVAVMEKDLRKASSWSIPDGYYAVPGLSQDLDFFRVKCPDKGKWKGWIFVEVILGGHDPIPARGQRAANALKRITEFGPALAAQKYGQEIGQCSKCHRSLTDETSRQLGRGPECRAKYGSVG